MASPVSPLREALGVGGAPHTDNPPRTRIGAVFRASHLSPGRDSTGDGVGRREEAGYSDAGCPLAIATGRVVFLYLAPATGEKES